MNQSTDNTGNGFLQGLKKIFFQDATREPDQPTASATTHHASATSLPTTTTIPTDGAILKEDIRQKILLLLDSRNKQGVDFLEVWRAAQDMGGASAANIRMAFTSLKHADPGLNKDRLVNTGQAYVAELESVFSQELTKREAEKKLLAEQREARQQQLQKTIEQLEQELNTLQQTLDARRAEWQQLQATGDTGVDQLDAKIRYGREALDTVVQDIQKVLSIIQQEIN